MKPITVAPSVYRQTMSPFMNYNGGLKGFTLRRTGYRQAKPYNLPLNFSFQSRKIHNFSTNEPGNWGAGCDSVFYHLTPDPRVYNQAYEKFKDKLGTAASLAVTLAERKQAVDMIAKRSLQLFQFTRALKKLNFHEASRILGVTAPPIRRVRYKKGRRQPFTYAVWRDDESGTVEQRARNFYLKKHRGRKPSVKVGGDRGLIREDSHRAFANNYLEFHFGWSPLVQDIGNSIEILTQGIPNYRIRGKASRTTPTTYSVGSAPVDKQRHLMTSGYTILARVEVADPNARLASQMGFVNPAVVAWELVPFSFVVDWFVNVGDVLSSYTDFLGFKFLESSVTSFNKDRVTTYYQSIDYGKPVGVVRKSGEFEAVNVKRQVGPIPGPSLAVKPPWVLSPRRGLAAVSLLIQSFLSPKKH